MDVEPIESVASSVIFGGLNQSVSLYRDHVVINNPGSPVVESELVRYDQIDEVRLYSGVLYATLTLGMRNGSRVMIRWLPKGRAIRVTDLLRERVRGV
jgi:hypothetical protein